MKLFGIVFVLLFFTPPVIAWKKTHFWSIIAVWFFLCVGELAYIFISMFCGSEHFWVCNDPDYRYAWIMGIGWLGSLIWAILAPCKPNW